MTLPWVLIIVFCSGVAATMLAISALLRLSLWYNSVYLPRQEPTLVEHDGQLYHQHWVYDPAAKTATKQEQFIISVDELMERAQNGETVISAPTPMPELYDLYDKDGNWKQ
jgi:hypothetical protein